MFRFACRRVVAGTLAAGSRRSPTAPSTTPPPISLYRPYTTPTTPSSISLYRPYTTSTPPPPFSGEANSGTKMLRESIYDRVVRVLSEFEQSRNGKAFFVVAAVLGVVSVLWMVGSAMKRIIDIFAGKNTEERMGKLENMAENVEFDVMKIRDEVMEVNMNVKILLKFMMKNWYAKQKSEVKDGVKAVEDGKG